MSCFILLVFMFIHVPLSVEESPVTCYSNDTTCAISEDNLIDSIGGVASIWECRQLCSNLVSCNFITYFFQNSFPYSEVCFLFQSCEDIGHCEECVSENRGCFQTCGTQLVGRIDENLLETIPLVRSEAECKEHCKLHSNCHFYTYFQEAEPYSQMCALLSSLLEPLTACDNCVTGPLDCQHYGCYFRSDDTSFRSSLMVTDPGTIVNVTIPFISDSAECQMTVLAVGGGGHGLNVGGGSGYVKYKELSVLGSQHIISLNVGDYSQSSMVSFHGEDGEVVIEAKPGHHGGINVGGNGYSGGGGGGQVGGADGGDGEHGGQGSGAAVSGYQLTNYDLGPGSGGQAYDATHGGGGGGVMVNGEGPAHGDQYQGLGYGGGGCTHYNDDGQYITNGLPGVVILEIKPSD